MDVKTIINGEIKKLEKTINEGFFKNLLNSLFGNNPESNLERTETLEEIENLLEFNNALNSEISDLLDMLINHPNVEEINFNILGRTMSNVLLKKGNKTSNVKKYLNKILNSLNKRITTSTDLPDEEYIDFEGEKSVISRRKFQREKTALQIELLKMQEWLKNSGSSVIILFEGRDTAGKGSTIRKFTEYLDPKFYKVVTKDIPTEEERKNWFARYEGDIEPGKIIFFDRSWYNRGIVEPVMGYSSYEEYEDFMKNVNGFEKSLVDAGNSLIKFWFSITKDTQAKRFDLRKGSPLKYWKYSPNDAKAQEKWEDYTRYKEEVFNKTSTPYAPWTIIDANDKRISGLNAMRYVLNEVPYEDKNEKIISMDYPEVVTTIRERINIKKIIREEMDDLQWIRDVSGKRLKPWELMNRLTEVFPEIEMEMTEDQVTTGGDTIEGELEITTHKEINPTNEQWFNRISGVMFKLSDNEKLPYLIGDWYENYYTGHLNDSDADWNIYGDLNDVIEYIKQYVGPNGEPHIYYGEEQEEW